MMKLKVTKVEVLQQGCMLVLSYNDGTRMEARFRPPHMFAGYMRDMTMLTLLCGGQVLFRYDAQTGNVDIGVKDEMKSAVLKYWALGEDYIFGKVHRWFFPSKDIAIICASKMMHDAATAIRYI